MVRRLGYVILAVALSAGAGSGSASQEEPIPTLWEIQSFVETTARQARAVNPAVSVIAGSSTHADVMYEAWASVRDVVHGFSLSIVGNDRVRVAVRFLRRLPS
jgi:hypothetical protein